MKARSFWLTAADKERLARNDTDAWDAINTRRLRYNPYEYDARRLELIEAREAVKLAEYKTTSSPAWKNTPAGLREQVLAEYRERVEKIDCMMADLAELHAKHAAGKHGTIEKAVSEAIERGLKKPRPITAKQKKARSRGGARNTALKPDENTRLRDWFKELLPFNGGRKMTTAGIIRRAMMKGERGPWSHTPSERTIANISTGKTCRKIRTVLKPDEIESLRAWYRQALPMNGRKPIQTACAIREAMMNNERGPWSRVPSVQTIVNIGTGKTRRKVGRKGAS